LVCFAYFQALFASPAWFISYSLVRIKGRNHFLREFNDN